MPDGSAQAGCPRWFPFRAEGRRPRVRLFCIPHAGAGAAAYLRWARALPDSVEVCAVELPGRARRMAEPRYRRIGQLLPALCGALRPLLDVPYLLHGHSMGALLAFEAARALERSEPVGPSGIVVSGMVAPPRWPVRAPVHHLDTATLIAQAGDFLGLPPDVLADQDLLDLLLPPLRADLELTETYRYRPSPPLRCPVTVLAGRHDPLAPSWAMPGWEEITTGACAIRTFEGGHFFLHECPEVLGVLRSALAAAAG